MAEMTAASKLGPVGQRSNDGAGRHALDRGWRARALGVAVIGLVAASCRSPAQGGPVGAAGVARTAPTGVGASSPRQVAPAPLGGLRDYIHSAWAPLTRTLATLPAAAADPKAPHVAGAAWPVYVPHDV